MLRFSVLKPEAPSVDKKQPQSRPEDKGKRGFSSQLLLYHKLYLPTVVKRNVLKNEKEESAVYKCSSSLVEMK